MSRIEIALLVYAICAACAIAILPGYIMKVLRRRRREQIPTSLFDVIGEPRSDEQRHSLPE
jgi:hypothetical protein